LCKDLKWFGIYFQSSPYHHVKKQKQRASLKVGYFRGAAGGSEGLVVEDAVVSPQWQPRSASFTLLCCVREELEKPFGVASHRDTHLSPKSRTVVQWSPNCSELAGFVCLSGGESELSRHLSLLHVQCGLSCLQGRGTFWGPAQWSGPISGQVSEMSPSSLSDHSSFSHRILA